MGFRPQTLYGIADSPVGLAAWMLDHDPASLELISRSFDGVPEGLTRDDVLDNITHFWLTNTGVSAGRLYWENKLPFFVDVKNVTLPVAVSVFPDEIYQAPRSWAERAFPKLIYYNKVHKGGHFQPGNSRNSFRKRFVQASDHCANSGTDEELSMMEMAYHVNAMEELTRTRKRH